MGAQKVRRLVLAAAAGALLASGAAASFYSYEGKWRGYLYWGDKRFWLYFVAGDDSAIGASYTTRTSAAGGGVGYGKFSSNGTPAGGGLVWSKYNISLESSTIYGFELCNGGAAIAFSVYYYNEPYGPYETESYLKNTGNPGWEMKTGEYGSFRAVTCTPDREYIYCYMNYLGTYRVCKITTTGAITSYFTPLAEPDDLAVGPAGYIYALSGDRVRKYDDNGSLVIAWYAPVTLDELSIDADNHILALARKSEYTYVFSDAGALLGSFTGPYENFYGSGFISADIGPDGKYFVGYPYGPENEGDWFVEMCLMAPSPTNIVPTSLGKIKAMFN